MKKLVKIRLSQRYTGVWKDCCVPLVLLGVVLGLWPSGRGWAAEEPSSPKEPPTTLEDLLRAAEHPGLSAQKEVQKSVPEAAAVQKAMKVLEEVYREDFAAAKTPDKKRALAGRLLAEALEAQVPVEQFVLLQAARQLAVQAGDVPLALRATEAAVERFQLDPLKVKTEVLEGLSRPGILAPPLEVADAAEPLIEDAVCQEAFDTAGRLCRVALNAARRTRNADLIKRLTTRSREIEQATKAYQKIQAAQETLRENPKDPAAHLVLGRHLCFSKGRWDQGLPHLAQCADETLRQLAEQDLAGPTEPAQQVSLAEGWWSRAEQEQDAAAKVQIQSRAAYWYQAALPHLSGLDKIKVEKRLQEAAQAKAASPDPASPRHYLDPANRKNIIVLFADEKAGQGEGSRFLQTEKVNGGYRLKTPPEIDWVVLYFPRVPVATHRLFITFTVEKNAFILNLRPMQPFSVPPQVVLPYISTAQEGRHTLEAWVEDGRIKATLDSRPIDFQADDPKYYGQFTISLKGGSSLVIHELKFTRLQK